LAALLYASAPVVYFAKLARVPGDRDEGFLTCLAAIAIGAVAAVGLSRMQEPVQQAFATSAVRL
jgi:hypothetical protein